MNKEKHLRDQLKKSIKVLFFLIANAFCSIDISASSDKAMHKFMLLDKNCVETLTDALRAAALIKDSLERAIALCEPAEEALLRSVQATINAYLIEICKEIEEIQYHIDQDSLLIAAKIEEVTCLSTQENGQLFEHIIQVQALVDKVYKQKEALLMKLGNTDQKGVENLSIQLDVFAKKITTGLTQRYTKEAEALNKSYTATSKKIREVERATRKVYQSIPALYRSAQTNIYGILQESLVAIETNITKMFQNVATQLDAIQIGNTSLVKTQINELAETANTIFYEILSDISNIKKNIVETYDALSKQGALMCATIIKQNQNLQALVENTNAIVSEKLCENTGLAQAELTKEFTRICTCISEVAEDMLAQTKECINCLAKTINKTMLNACSKIIAIDATVTRQLQNSAANTIKECVEALQYVCLGITEINNDLCAHGTRLSNQLNRVDNDITNRLCKKVSQVETNQITAKNSIVRLLRSAFSIISEQVCQKINNAKADLSDQAIALCTKINEMYAHLAGTINHGFSRLASELNDINSSLCSKIMTIETDLSAQMRQDISNAFTEIGLQNNDLALQINEYYTGLHDLIGQKIEAHDAKSKRQYMHACRALMAIIDEENEKAAMVGTKIDGIAQAFVVDVQLFMLELPGIFTGWNIKIALILLIIAEIAIELAMVPVS